MLMMNNCRLGMLVFTYFQILTEAALYILVNRCPYEKVSQKYAGYWI